MQRLSAPVHRDHQDPQLATKLDLRIWIGALFLIVTSSKGVSSVVLARQLGVTQKTAWKIGHALREPMDDRDGLLPMLTGIVEVDEKYVGGAPKYKHGVKNKRGYGTRKVSVFVAVSRDGQARLSHAGHESGRPCATGAALRQSVRRADE